MSTEEVARAAAVARQEAEAMQVDAPNTPTAAAPTGPVEGGPPDVGIATPTPTLQEMMGIMTGILQMMADDKKKNAHYMASAKLDEKYFRSITKFDNTKSGWKEWRRHFLNAVRECDDSFADLIEGYEKHDGPLDSLHA